MGNVNRSLTAATRRHNRIGALMVHCTRYSFRGTTRLASDAGRAKSTLCELINGKSNPLYSTLGRLVKLFERELGIQLDVREIVSEDGTYPTPFICQLVGCPGCLPDDVYEEDGSRNPAFRHIQSGQWTGDSAEFEEASNGGSR